jgi:outer membrane protein assembly factor BamD (BamD/ComL family)
MKRQSIIALCTLSLLLLVFQPLHALRKKGFKTQAEAECYLNTHYQRGCEYYNRGLWRTASAEFERVLHFFPSSAEAVEASYYLAICYFEMREYDFANVEFSRYLKTSSHPTYFEDAVYYKFCIAEHFKAGKKKRPFTARYLPKWISAQDLALTIYDEVVAALPNHALTVKALYSKAELLKCMREYRESVEAYQLIIRRFPRDEIVPVCYLNIADAYYQQSRYEFQNPDILALAELNARKFREDFPRDERVDMADDYVRCIKELYAKGLCDLGLFYERMHQPAAAAIYFQSSIEEFPDTQVAQFCRSRLACLGYQVEEEPSSCEFEVDPTLNLLDKPTPAEQAEMVPIDDVFPFQEEGIEPAVNNESDVTQDVSNALQLNGLGVTCQAQEPVVIYDRTCELFDQPASYSYNEEEVPNGVAEAALAGGVPLVVEGHAEEEPQPYIHYSLLKKRDVKYYAPPQGYCSEFPLD